MAITDELRDWILNTYSEWPSKQAKGFAIADRIDAEYEEALGSKVARAIATGEDDTEFVFLPEKELSECYMELPKDADGEPIHVGDWMTPNGMDTGFKVRQMYYNGEWSLDLEGFGISQTCPDVCRHYHKPPVKDILQELVTKVWNRGRLGMPVSESLVRKLVSEYSDKLRLAGDDG